MRELISQLAHALEVAAICTGGFLLFSAAAPGVYAGLAAWTLKEGSNVYTKWRWSEATLGQSLLQEKVDIVVGYGAVLLSVAVYSLI